MSRLLPEAFHPQVGLSAILLTESAEGARLPDDSRLQPIDAAVEARLRAMLQAETFDRLILEAVRPSVADREVLSPGRFHALRGEVMAKIGMLYQNTRDADERAELKAAWELLQRRTSEHELGEALRYALIKG